MHIVCSSCGERYPLNTRKWVCRRCGGLFEIADAPAFDPAMIDPSIAGLWRYQACIPLPENARPVSLGEGWTPLVETKLDGRAFLGKLDFMMPTGSFKDRGTTVLVSALKAFDFTRVVEDSSGNAAASLSGYSAYAGLQAEIYAPAHASPAKLAQIQVYGAHLTRVEGPREKASEAAQQAARRGEAYYASHYYNPFELAGMKTTAWEIWEQMGRRAPAAVIAPVGHGANLLGLARGFHELNAVGLIDTMPRLYGAQSENISPLARAFAKGRSVEGDGPAHAVDKTVEQAWDQGLEEAALLPPARTIAEGIALTRPVHAKQVLRVMHSSGGAAIAVAEEAIAAARTDLAKGGLYVEPTSATAVAAFRHLMSTERFDGPIVVILTGSGLKTA